MIAFFAGIAVLAVALFFFPELPDFAAAKADVAGILLPILFVAPALPRGPALSIPFRAPLLALLGAFAVSLFAATDRFAGVRAVVSLGGAIVFAALVRSFSPNARETRRFLSIGVLAGSLVAAYGLLQRLGVDFPAVLRVYESRVYPVSTFGNTNAATEFVAPCVALALSGLVTGSLPLPLTIASLGLGSLYIGTAGTRAALVALAVASLFLLARYRSRRSLIPIVFLAALVAAGFFLRPSAPPPTSGPAVSSPVVPDSFEVRARIYRATARMAIERPWLGVGAGNFTAAFPPYRDPVEAEISSEGFALESGVETAHNDPLEIAASTGILGGLALGWLVLVLGRACVRGPLLVAVPVVAIGVNSLFRSPLIANPPTLLLFLGLLGLLDPLGAVPRPSRTARGLALLLLPPFAAVAFFAKQHLSAQSDLAAYFRSEQRDRQSLEFAAAAHVPDARLLAILGRDLVVHEPRDPARAVGVLDRALRLRPHDPAALQNRAIALAQQERFGEAARDLLRAREISPRDPRIPHNLGQLALIEGDDDRALAFFREEMRLRPTVSPLLDRAREFERQGILARAASYVRAHLDERPGDLEAVRADAALRRLLAR